MASNSDADHLLAIRSLRELFSGRFNDVEMSTLYKFNNNDKHQTANYIFEVNPTQADVASMTQKEQESWKTVNRKRPQLKKNVIDRAISGKIDTTPQQFACGPCDSVWWRKTPTRKKVSVCHMCRTRYDPVPPEKQWGWAEFNCPGCGNTFFGFCQMGTSSPCFQCWMEVLPLRIHPPQKNARRRKTQYMHRCSCCQPGRGLYLKCAHPAVRMRFGLPKVLLPSNTHDSTGSTVATFLPQDNLAERYYDVYMDTIPEEPPGNSPGSNNSGSR